MADLKFEIIKKRSEIIQKNKNSKRFQEYNELIKKSDFVFKRKKRLINKKSKAESKFKKLLTDAKIFFLREEIISSNKGEFYYTDFHIPSLNLNIEIDGKEHSKRIKKDERKEFLSYKNDGFVTIRFTNDDVMKMDSISTNILNKKIQEVFSSSKHNYLNYEKWCSLCDKKYNNYLSEVKKVYKTVDTGDMPVTIYKHGGEFHYNNFFELLKETRVDVLDAVSSLNRNIYKGGLKIYFTNQDIYKEKNEELITEYKSEIDRLIHTSDLILVSKSYCKNKPKEPMNIHVDIYEDGKIIETITDVIDSDEFSSNNKADIISITRGLEMLAYHCENPNTNITVVSNLKFVTQALGKGGFKHKVTSNYADALPDFINVSKMFNNINFVWLPKKATEVCFN